MIQISEDSSKPMSCHYSSSTPWTKKISLSHSPLYLQLYEFGATTGSVCDYETPSLRAHKLRILSETGGTSSQRSIYAFMIVLRGKGRRAQPKRQHILSTTSNAKPRKPLQGSLHIHHQPRLHLLVYREIYGISGPRDVDICLWASQEIDCHSRLCMKQVGRCEAGEMGTTATKDFAMSPSRGSRSVSQVARPSNSRPVQYCPTTFFQHYTHLMISIEASLSRSFTPQHD